MRVDHTRNYLIKGTDHLEIHVVSPRKAAIPLTDTGYRSHFIDANELLAAGGVQSFIQSWLQREAQSKDWQKKERAAQQGDLFQWAAAKAETGSRKRAAKPSAPGSKRRRGKRPGSQHG